MNSSFESLLGGTDEFPKLPMKNGWGYSSEW